MHLRPSRPKDLDFNLQFENVFVPQSFIKFDIRQVTTRTIVFATGEQLGILKNSEIWYVDATYKVVRGPFRQLFTVSASMTCDGSTKLVPLAFALMKLRQTEHYKQIFWVIVGALEDGIKLKSIV